VKTVGEVDSAGRILRVFHRSGTSAWTHEPEGSCDTCPEGMAAAIAAHNAAVGQESAPKWKDDPAAYMRAYRAKKRAEQEAPRPPGRPRKTELERKQAAAARARRAYARKRDRSHGLLPESRHGTA
jgi:hypothetical protein